MAILTLKNLPDSIYEELRQLASLNRRSIVAEATIILERALGKRSLVEEEILTQADLLRERSSIYLTQQNLKKAISEGRL